MKRIKLIAGGIAASALVSSPAFATVAQRVPEPSTLSLMAGTAVAVIIASRFIRRK